MRSYIISIHGFPYIPLSQLNGWSLLSLLAPLPSRWPKAMHSPYSDCPAESSYRVITELANWIPFYLCCLDGQMEIISTTHYTLPISFHTPQRHLCAFIYWTVKPLTVMYLSVCMYSWTLKCCVHIFTCCFNSMRIKEMCNARNISV